MGIRWEWKRELLNSRWIGSFPFGIKGLIRKLIITVSTGWLTGNEDTFHSS